MIYAIILPSAIFVACFADAIAQQLSQHFIDPHVTMRVAILAAMAWGLGGWQHEARYARMLEGDVSYCYDYLAPRQVALESYLRGILH